MLTSRLAWLSCASASASRSGPSPPGSTPFQDVAKPATRTVRSGSTTTTVTISANTARVAVRARRDQTSIRFSRVPSSPIGMAAPAGMVTLTAVAITPWSVPSRRGHPLARALVPRQPR